MNSRIRVILPLTINYFTIFVYFRNLKGNTKLEIYFGNTYTMEKTHMDLL